MSYCIMPTGSELEVYKIVLAIDKLEYPHSWKYSKVLKDLNPDVEVESLVKDFSAEKFSDKFLEKVLPNVDFNVLYDYGLMSRNWRNDGWNRPIQLNSIFNSLRVEINDKIRVRPGDIYEDCNYTPRACIKADYDFDELVGVSLADGTVGHCSPTHCGVVKLDLDKANKILEDKEAYIKEMEAKTDVELVGNSDWDGSGLFDIEIWENSYPNRLIGTYQNISLRLDSEDKGMSFMRIIHPFALDAESDRCVIAEMRVAGLSISSMGASFWLEGWMAESSFWTEMPDYNEKYPPYFPSDDKLAEYSGKVRIVVTHTAGR